MDRPLSTLILFFVISVAAASATAAASAVADPEDYWHEVLPDTPIPRAIKTLLCPDLLREVRDTPVNIGGMFITYLYYDAAAETQAHNDLDCAGLFFLQQLLHPNAKTSKLRFIRGTHPAPFIPRSVAGAIPFSSEKLPELMARFSQKPNSAEVEDMRKSLQRCEHHAAPGETKSCVTSLESMVDFITTNLGTRDVRASSTEVTDELRQQKRQFYTVARVESLQREGDGRVITCHEQLAPYAVFYCHAIHGTTRAYKVQLVGQDDGSKVTAIAICHVDTLDWNPRYLAFQVLKVKPGSPVCHFLPLDHVVWTPSTSWAPTM